MNDGTKKVIEKLEEIGLGYTSTENENLLVVSLGLEDLGVPIKYAMGIDNLEDDEYTIFIISGPITKINNEIEVLKLINEINWDSSYITYVINEGEVKCKVESFSHLEAVVEDVLSLINLMNSSISKNYSKLMKSNWT